MYKECNTSTRSGKARRGFDHVFIQCSRFL